MPRQARKKSETGIYHIMLRGVNGQQIFEESEDYIKFLQILKECKAISGYNLFAYCLMGNHIHILLQETNESIETLMKRIATRFVYWYNIKYQRTGHLFQDRFKSEPINDNAYFLTVLRYIHQNPIKAKLSKTVKDYKYSSFNEYFASSDLIDKDFVFEIIAQADFEKYNNEIDTTVCLDVLDKRKIKVTDEQAKRKIEKISKCRNATEFQNLTVDKRDKYLKALREKGLSIRQISRLTGTSFNIVRKF